MTRLEAALRRAAEDLNAIGARWALVGGLAVSVRTEPRFTRDVDLAVAVRDDPEAEAVLQACRARGYEVVTLVEQDEVGRLATGRLLAAGEEMSGVVIDLLFASSGIEPEIAREAECIAVFQHLMVPVARVGHLIASKLLAEDDERPTDRGDLIALTAAAGESELKRAASAVEVIRERGYARGRDLTAALHELLAG